MLVSHRKKFIFTKTVKTAGTSVEAYFEPYCVTDTNWEILHSRPEHVCSDGIIGYRGKRASKSGSTWFNHMPAARIKELLGDDVWDEYLKFTVIRNPFDKMISGFYMFDTNREAIPQLSLWQKILGQRVPKQRNRMHLVTGDSPIERFRSWVQVGGRISDENKYKIDSEVCVDEFIRFESLNDDIRSICEKLDIEFDPSRIPKLKSGVRKGGIPIKDFYDQATEDLIRQRYKWEIETFNYDMPE